MTAPSDNRPTRGSVLLVRLGGLLTSLLAAVGLVLLPLPADGSQAHAAAGTGSEVTKSGTKGPYDDFSGLKVTVEQTKKLRTQGVKVSWTGGAPTNNGSSDTAFNVNFLQIMQCWGKGTDGPTRDQCEFGNPPKGIDSGTASRQVSAGSVDQGADPLETTSGQVPFTSAAGGSTADGSDVNTFFSGLTTNEQPVTTTGLDGSGETIFSLEDGTTSPILGCGLVANAGQSPAPCWLVVVPRGTHEANGSLPSAGRLISSPLSASNWAQRIVFRLDFDSTETGCRIGENEQQAAGSLLVSEAMSSWEPAMCTGDNVNITYIGQQEDTSRAQVAGPVPGSPAALALVENPVAPDTATAPVVHAPVAVSGLVIAYNMQIEHSSKQVPRIRLNARLVAKMLSESYQCDLPGANTDVSRGDLPAKNPAQISDDPEFLALNKDAGFSRNPSCQFGLGVPQGDSDTDGQLWRWLRSDPDARSFLSGDADPWGMVINPHFLALKPATSALKQFDKPDPTQYAPDPANYPDIKASAVSMNPYGGDLSDDAQRLIRANNKGQAASINPQAVPVQLTPYSPQIPGQHFMMGVTDSASAARFRLGTAELLNADGEYVGPTVDGMTKAVSGMKDGAVPGVLDADPGRKVPGAYPLTSVTYAAASTALDTADRTTYATMIRFVAGSGQTPGIGDGLLPPGYAPLNKGLRDQALAAASALVAGQPATTAPGGGAAAGGVNGGAGSAGGTIGSDGGTGTASGGSATGGSPSPSAAAAAGSTTKGSAGGASPPVTNVARTGGTTPSAILGAIRWVLLVVLIVGIAGSLAGPLLMRAGAIRGTGQALFPFGSRKPA